MAQLEEIEILIDEKGKVTFQVRGIPGKACLNTTKQLEEALGNEVIKREYTDEYYSDKPVENRSQLRLKTKKEL